MGVLIIFNPLSTEYVSMWLFDYVPVLEGKVATITFIVSALSLILLTSHVTLLYVILLESTYILILLFLWRYVQMSRVVLLSHLLGILFAVGMFIVKIPGDIRYLGVYLMVLAFFHTSEYVVTAIHNPHTLRLDSFLLNHSKEYGIAAVASWIEYVLEYMFLPWLKSYWYISWLGIVLVFGGEVFRKVAMLTAMSNFTHNVQYYKRYNHSLVTHGVYGLVRHPSYVGWFYWSIGTQFLLCNPVCAVLYTIAAWMFFKDRIEVEEECLVGFFGRQYLKYQKNVGTGLPFIEGFVSDTRTVNKQTSDPIQVQ